MTRKQMTDIRKATLDFRMSPSPQRATNLLVLLTPHRGYDVIQRLIDEVLGYVYLVGTLDYVKEEEVAAGG